MTETFKIALTAVSGVAVFVVGQLLQKLFVEPLQDQRKTIARIAHALTYHANAMPAKELYDSGGRCGLEPDELKEVRKELRDLASELTASVSAIPFYAVFVRLRLTPSRARVQLASSGLIGWSNGLGSGGVEERRKQIADALNIRPYE